MMAIAISGGMPRYLVIIEQAEGNLSAFVPDVPGCVAAGRSWEEAARNIQEALQLHLAGLLQDRLPLPAPTTSAMYIAV